MLKLERGVVSDYDRECHSGVLEVLDDHGKKIGEELEFSGYNARLIEVHRAEAKGRRDREMVFVYEIRDYAQGMVRTRSADNMSVRIGSELAFERTVDGSGVAYWTRLRYYEEAVRTVTGPNYRVIRETTRPSGEPRMKVICHDLSADELASRYPIKPHDPFASRITLAGWEVEYRFEVWDGSSIRSTRFGGAYFSHPGWYACEDPRR